jgi:hypothetical protein
MTKANRLYGSLLMNVFILSPLAFQTYNPSLAISFSGLAYLMCPMISIISIMALSKSRCHYTANGLIILLGHCLILVYILVRAYAVL